MGCCWSNRAGPDPPIDPRDGVSTYCNNYSSSPVHHLTTAYISSSSPERHQNNIASASQNYQGYEQRQTFVQELAQPAGDESSSYFDRRYGLKIYSYDELAEATDRFSNNELLGEGAFGQVFKGILDGEVVAIKKLKTIQDEEPENPEIQLGEIDFLSIVRHQNVVKLIGYCNEGRNWLLVLEYVPNKSLRSHLHGKSLLKWSDRIKIAIGSAEGLQYLHEGCGIKIIHRDIKADNILLDNNFESKVADFSLAKFLRNTSVSHITSILKGTNIYADPEYGDTQRVSEKSDVYSFGVVLLELISGRKLMDKNIDIVTWARTQIEKVLGNGEYRALVATILQSYNMEKIEQITTALVDPKLMENYNKEEVKRMIFCAMACINKNSKYRPRMQKIVGVLKGTITPPRKILDWEDNKSLYRNNNGNFLRPTVKKLSIISKIDDEDIVGIRLYVFTYKKLENATDCFSKNKLLSKGRFGEVYIGYIDFTIVTIKKFIDISGKQDVFEEIKDIGSSVQHRNLVNLIGYCDDGFNKLLVYEFVHKESSLRCHLHGNGRSNLDWPTRLHIALSIARGLIKLHDTPWKIYEDYNDDCIFLGDNFEPKFAEYGHAHFFSKPATSSSASSWPSIHDAEDAYFFGLVLLELITGKQPVHDIINWAMPLLASSLRNGQGKNSFVDDKLKDYDNEEMHRMIACALACLRKMPPYPPQMNEVIEVLKGHRSLETLDALGEVYSWTAIYSSFIPFAIQG